MPDHLDLELTLWECWLPGKVDFPGNLTSREIWLPLESQHPGKFDFLGKLISRGSWPAPPKPRAGHLRQYWYHSTFLIASAIRQSPRANFKSENFSCSWLMFILFIPPGKIKMFSLKISPFWAENTFFLILFSRNLYFLYRWSNCHQILSIWS